MRVRTNREATIRWAFAILLGATASGCGDSSDDGTGATGAASGTSSLGSGGSGAGGGSTAGSGATSTGSGGQGAQGAGGSSPGCALVDLSAAPAPVTLAAGCTGDGCTSVGFTPLTELVGETYMGLEGGLYCDANEPPADYAGEGLALASSIGPLDAQGMPDPAGKYALVGIGMSHTTMEFSAFMQKHGDDPSIHPNLVLVDGALGGHATPQWLDPANEVWTTLTSRLQAKEVADPQVVAVWVKQARQTPQAQCDEAGISEPCFFAHESLLADEITTIVGMLKTRFVNLSLVYLSSRSYAGYASSDLNPEPFAYGSAFVMKKLIMERIAGAPEAEGLPWLAWGPYLWADGTTPRADGLTWVREDFVDDGTHPSMLGRGKVADMLFDFFSTDPSTKPWFLAPP